MNVQFLLMLPGVGNDMFRFGGVKIFIDGTASDGIGHPVDDLKWTQNELNEFVSEAHAAGLQLPIKRLGYTHWVAQGGDWGAGVATWLAKQHADGLVGVPEWITTGAYTRVYESGTRKPREV